jgi:threonine dehydrogenase-like Zn-dependent dehydrogenase
VAFIGECHDELPTKVSPDLVRKRLTLYGSRHYSPNDYPNVMDVVRRLPLIERLISHVIPLSRIQEEYELSASHQTVQVIPRPWE